MAPGLVGIALGRMFYTCSCDVFIETRFPFYVKAGFFLMVFHWFFHYFGPAKASKLDLNLELCWTSSWDRSWIDVGRFLGGQDGAKTAQDGSKLAPRRHKMASKMMLKMICKSMCEDFKKY